MQIEQRVMELQIGIEPLSVPDFLRLAELQWQETETYQTHELNLQVDRYVEYNQAGVHLWYTVRAGSKIVGHAGMYLDVSMHTGVIIASEDMWFVEKEYRNGGIGSELVRFVEEDVKLRGAKEMHVSTKETNPRAGDMVLRMGYSLVGRDYMKVL